jgi:TolB-like protein
LKRFAAFIFILLVISAPLIVTAGGAKEGASSERGKYLAGRGIIVPPEEIYIDSYVSYIDYHYPKPDSGVGVSLYSGHRQISAGGQEEVIQIGIQGRETSFKELPPMNIAFIIDKSKSMSEQDKMDWVKDAFDIFIERVREKDFVSLVVFDDEAKVIFPTTQMRSMQERMKLKDAVHSIIPGGGDNLEAGLSLGYKQVEANFRKDYSNRVLLLSDGTLSGEEEVSGIFQMVENFNEMHINLSTIGVGVNYNLELMRNLADAGEGSSRFISNREEMERTFGSDLDRTFVPTARNLFMKLEFLQDVEILGTWGYDNRIEGNTIHYYLGTLHHRDYETILAQIRIPPQSAPGSTQRKNLIRFSLSYTDLKCRQHYPDPYYLTVNFVDIQSPVTGYSDGMVLQSGTMLHYAQALKKIGELYYTEQLQPALDLSISAQKEIKNVRLKLGNKGFDNEIEILDKYIAILGQDLGLSETELKKVIDDEEIAPPVRERSLEDHIEYLFREMTLKLESKEEGSISILGFMTGEGKQSDLTILLNEMALVEFTKLESMRVIERQRVNEILEGQGIASIDLMDITNAIEIGKLLAVNYIITGSVVESSKTVVIFGRIINVETTEIESVAQVIAPKNSNVESLF